MDEDRRKAEELQGAVVNHPHACYVEACAGAGKTQTLVRRVVRQLPLLPMRQGIAVLSFTNSAVDEFTERFTAETTSTLKFPHFVGTFDAFLNHFIVLPHGLIRCQARPVIVDAWHDIQIHHGISGVRAGPIALKNFDADGLLTGRAYANLRGEQKGCKNGYEAAAKRRLEGFARKGMIDVVAARRQSIRSLIKLLMDIENVPVDERVALHQLKHTAHVREYFRKAIEVLEALPPACVAPDGVKAWVEAAEAMLLKVTGVKARLPVGIGKWINSLSPQPVAGTRYATVHEAKGKAYDAVCVVVDTEREKRNLLEEWKARSTADSEALRVLYVAIIRARKLLVLAVQERDYVVVHELLSAADVPVAGTAPSVKVRKGRKNNEVERAVLGKKIELEIQDITIACSRDSLGEDHSALSKG